MALTPPDAFPHVMLYLRGVGAAGDFGAEPYDLQAQARGVGKEGVEIEARRGRSKDW